MPNSDDAQPKRPARPFAPPFKGPASTAGAGAPLKPRPTPSGGAPRFFTPRPPSPAAGSQPVRPQTPAPTAMPSPAPSPMRVSAAHPGEPLSVPAPRELAPPETSEEVLRRAAQNAAFAVDLPTAEASAPVESGTVSITGPAVADEGAVEAAPVFEVGGRRAEAPPAEEAPQAVDQGIPSWLQDSPADDLQQATAAEEAAPASEESPGEPAVAEGGSIEEATSVVGASEPGWDELASVSMGDLPVEPAPVNRDVFLTPAAAPPATPETWSPAGDTEPADDDEDPFGWGTTAEEQQEVVAPGYSMGGSGGPGPALEPGQRGEELASMLEQLAQKIRDGELKAPSVDPSSGDAAALAAVLASLLGRSR